LRRLLVLLLAMLVVAGCGGGKTAYVVKQYLPEYPPPAAPAQPKIDDVIRVEPFSTAQAFAGTAMVYRPSPYQRGVYSRERWRVMPGDMVTDFMLRDLRASGAFRAVLGYEDPGEGRFVLTGTVTEFLETDGGRGPAARLAADVTLLDKTRREITQRVVFQKTYAFEEAMQEKSARALAEAMSGAMQKFSAALVADVHRAVVEPKNAKAP